MLAVRPEVEEMHKILCLIARLIVARHECTYVQHCKENAPIYMYYVAPETPMMSSVIADCPDLAPPPNILDKSTPMGALDLLCLPTKTPNVYRCCSKAQ